MTNILKSPSSYCDAVTLCLMRGEACGVGCRVRRIRSLASEETRDIEIEIERVVQVIKV